MDGNTAKAPIHLVKRGTALRAWGFTCIPDGEMRVVQTDMNGALYIDCDHGHHLLDGQVDDTDTFSIGLTMED